MKKRIIDTNKHLLGVEHRREAIFQSVVASSKIEGIILTKSQQKKIVENVAKRLKK